MAKSRDWDELQYVWTEWRRRSGMPIKDLYQQLVTLNNDAARLNSTLGSRSDEIMKRIQRRALHSWNVKNKHRGIAKRNLATRRQCRLTCTRIAKSCKKTTTRSFHLICAKLFASQPIYFVYSNRMRFRCRCLMVTTEFVTFYGT